MNSSEKAIDLYQEIKVAINDKLLGLGYAPVHEEAHDVVFDSRYMIWSNNVEAMRFTWDGKEQWFCLEITEDLPLKPLSHWDEILVKPFDKSTLSHTQEYVDAFLTSLS